MIDFEVYIEATQSRNGHNKWKFSLRQPSPMIDANYLPSDFGRNFLKQLVFQRFEKKEIERYWIYGK